MQTPDPLANRSPEELEAATEAILADFAHLASRIEAAETELAGAIRETFAPREVANV